MRPQLVAAPSLPAGQFDPSDSTISSGSGQIAQEIIGSLIRGALFLTIKTIELTYFCIKTGANKLYLLLFSTPVTALKNEISHSAHQTEKLEANLLSIKERTRTDGGDVESELLSDDLDTCLEITSQIKTSAQEQKTHANSLEKQLSSEQKLREKSQKELAEAQASNRRLSQENAQLASDNEELETNYQELKANYQQLKAEIPKFKALITQQEESLAAVQAQQTRENTQNQAQSQAQNEEIQRLHHQDQTQQQQLRNTQADYATLQTCYNQLASRLAEYERTTVLIRKGPLYIEMRK